jgi:CRISPR-associated protein Csb2
VDHQHADGQILGVAIAVPHDLDPEAYATLWNKTVEPPLEKLTLRRDHVLRLEPPGGAASSWGLNPERWTAADRGGARTWVTATPLMLDRYVKRSRGKDAVVTGIAESLVRAGYPEPAEVEFSPAPMIRGPIQRPRPGTIPPKRPRRPTVHVRVVFDEPVAGPVLAGSMRYLGLGLFVPTGKGR